MFNNITTMVKSIILLNIAMYVCTVAIAPQTYDLFALYFFENPKFEIWQIFTHMFMHDNFSFLHILFNMYGLFLFGPALEKWMGSNKFLFFYLSSGIGAYLLTTGIDYYQYQQFVTELSADGYGSSEIQKILFPTDGTMTKVSQAMVGASGCLFGVLAGFALLYPNVKLQLLFIPFPIAAKWLIGAYVAYETLSVIGVLSLQDNIGHAAHVGGAIVGAILVFFWKRNDMDRFRIY